MTVYRSDGGRCGPLGVLGAAMVSAAVAVCVVASRGGLEDIPDAIEARNEAPATAADLDHELIERHRAHLRDGAPCPVCDAYRD